MTQVILFNKPFQVLCQFSPHEKKTTLKDYIPILDVYPCGRLDFDSEGLLILSNNGSLQSLISQPKNKMPKTYWVQVEGDVTGEALERLRAGVELKDGLTLPAEAEKLAEPDWLWPRNPPIRERKNIPTSWLKLIINEGKNRQVRRMTAAVGFPTLRLIRTRIGPWHLTDIAPGEWCRAELDSALKKKLKNIKNRKLQNNSRKHLTNGRGRKRQNS